VDYLSILFSPSGSRAVPSSRVPARVPSALVDRYMEDALEQGLWVQDRGISRDGFPTLRVAGEVTWQGPQGKRDLAHALAVLAEQNPRVTATVKRDAGSGDLVFTLDGRTT